MHSSQLQQLRAACLRGDAAAAQRLLAGRAAFGCLGDASTEQEQALAGALLAPLPGDAGNTLLHHLASGEGLGIGGCLLLSLAGGSPRSAAGGGPAVWPSKHQRGRAQALALVLARQPRSALLAGSRNAAGVTPLHCCVLSRSWQVLAVLLASLQQLLSPAGVDSTQQERQQQQDALQLLLSVPDASGLSPLELAIKLRQWPAARLLAAAAGGRLPLSRDQIAACSLVQQYLRLSRSSSGHSLASGSGAAAAEEQQGIRVSASGATVTEALGGLLSKLWDAFSATPAGEAAVDELAAAARLDQAQLGGSSGEGSSSSAAGGASDSACIDEGDPRRAVCPEPGCGTALPSAAAARLLPAAALDRFQLLVVQRFVTARPHDLRSCPAAGCGALLHLAGPAAAASQLGTAGLTATGAAGADAAAAAAVPAAVPAAVVAAAAPGAGLDAECGACGHLLCWRCGEEAHEPASCAQMRRWGEELAELRAAAPSADVQWLTSNTKRCPQCLARIQKHGGCNHMTCKGCGHHFCWVCGRAWSQHSESTGGFFYCNLDQHHELPEYSMASSGASEAGSMGGPLAWLAGVWGSIKAAAQQQQLQRHLRQYLRLSGSRGALFAAAAQMQRLLMAAGVADGGTGNSGSGSGSSSSSGSLGPEALGVSPGEAARMSDLEWSQIVAAAAASVADAAAQLPPLAADSAKSAAQAALAAASGASSSGSAAAETAYLQQLAEGVAAARGLLQHSAVALYQLPAGTHRRHLQQLSAAMQSSLLLAPGLLL
ncbi:ankyrin repeat and IBR domain-containing 1-like [Chlorella sorokiniana]|uniref:RBR-type E3 ubiquitin transferase n=1 Tax=Chlorella sorokiniana TaxID=3076 RepID=A0A2P6TJU4_CHLSO|nr:ankyrin repeat and IBR domain-containing 1-like [Chlorella sorokiniana]|eukprot:PRW44356.1 ankyrin repeat and IBR domain-containing 1-like [Chlorella sorokiniana]